MTHQPAHHAASRAPLVALCVCALLAACVAAEQPLAGSAVQYTEEREACEERDPLRRLLFGDLHVHTRHSWDAQGYGLAVSPAESYGFARGQPVRIPGAAGETRQVQLGRPLDFAAITDHAEFLGETQLCTDATSAAYGTRTCESFRKGGGGAVSAWGLQLIAPGGKPRQTEVCGADGLACQTAARDVWQALRGAAEAANDRSAACSFVAFAGYEHTATPKGTNQHRNVLFRNAQAVDAPISYYEAPEPLDLWLALDAQCAQRAAGCEALVVPHNTNMSNGTMFVPDFTPRGGLPDEAAVVALRARIEPLLEVFQHKGDMECQAGIAGLGDDDAQCAFEKERPAAVSDCGDQPGWGGMNATGCLSRWDFLRGILAEGLRVAGRLGANPYRVGVLGSTDTHDGTPGNTAERTWPGHVGDTDDTPEERLGEGNVTHRGLVNNPGGLAAVWAVERSRDAIFEALQRREVYATSGTRIALRFFGGWGYAERACDDAAWLAPAYRAGVPMGGVLRPRPGAAEPPRFIVQAQRDPEGAPLQRLQLVKGWIDAAGVPQVRVHDVAGEASAGSVDPATCAADGQGTGELCAVWEDPDFDPRVRAYYYARVLEAPSCRWSAWQCNAMAADARPPGCTDPRVQRVIQERAWSSPVWYEPGD